MGPTSILQEPPRCDICVQITFSGHRCYFQVWGTCYAVEGLSALCTQKKLAKSSGFVPQSKVVGFDKFKFKSSGFITLAGRHTIASVLTHAQKTHETLLPEISCNFLRQNKRINRISYVGYYRDLPVICFMSVRI
jgi:hypothetical protein